MKIRVLILSLAIFTGSNLFAQEFSAKFFLAPSASFSHDGVNIKYDDKTEKLKPDISLNVTVPVGKYLTNKLAIGGYVRYSYMSNASNYFDNDGELNTQVDKTNSYFIGFFLRNNFPLGERVNFLIDSDAGVGFGNIKDEGSNDNITELRSNYYLLSSSPGFNFKVSESVYLEAFIGSLYFSQIVMREKDAENEDPRTINNSFGLNYNSITFGVMFLL